MNPFDYVRAQQINRKMYRKLKLMTKDLLKTRRLSLKSPAKRYSTRSSISMKENIDDQNNNSIPVVQIHEVRDVCKRFVKWAEIQEENKLLGKLIRTFEREIKLYKAYGIETPKRLQRKFKPRKNLFPEIKPRSTFPIY